MDYQEVIIKIKPELEKTIHSLENELAQLRAGRPASSLLEEILVDYLGRKHPLRSLGTITPSGREIIISPWDESYFDPIKKALSQSVLGLSLVDEKERIRVSFPPLSEELRKNLLSILFEKKERTREKIRQLRDQSWKEIQERERAGEIRQDDKYRGKDRLQEWVDEHNKKIDEMVERKEKEIME